MPSAERTLHPGEFIIPSNYMNVDISSGIMTMLKEIDWTEPWLICLLMFHFLTAGLVFSTRQHSTVQFLIFAVLLALVYGAQNINKLCAEHWKTFSNQQYFDSSGLFISIVFSCPLLLNCIMMIGHWLWTSAVMMRSLRSKIQLEQQRASVQRPKSD